MTPTRGGASLLWSPELRCAAADRFATWLARVAGDEWGLESLTTARRAAVAAVAFGLTGLVPPLWDAARTAAGYAGRRIPRLLAAVVTSEPSRSWAEFRVDFPEQFERDDLSWSELVAVARRVYGVPDSFASTTCSPASQAR
jgi:hypothetical protein